jgi:S1-C subfamily serine protease
MRLLAASVTLAALFFSSVFITKAQDASATTQKILPSLALIIASSAKTTELGTAFCFWSTPSKSYFLTNRHVVEGATEVQVRPQLGNGIGQPTALYKGRVYPVKAPYADPITVNLPEQQDLRVVVIDVGKIPYLTLSTRNPALGQSIGIAGFPWFQYAVADDARTETPSVHFGHANSFPELRYIEFDAVTDHGNSGGPLFDGRTGIVYGVVTLVVQSQKSQAVQNNLAIDANSVGVFLSDLRLPYLSHDDVLGGTLNMGVCNRPRSVKEDMQRTLIASLQADNWWCSLPDAPRP